MSINSKCSMSVSQPWMPLDYFEEIFFKISLPRPQWRLMVWDYNILYTDSLHSILLTPIVDIWVNDSFRSWKIMLSLFDNSSYIYFVKCCCKEKFSLLSIFSSHYVPPNTLLLFNIIHYYVDVQIMPELASGSPSFSFSVPLTHSVGSETR